MKREASNITVDTEVAASGDFGARVYRDEPILLAEPQAQRFIPPKIREMRKLARSDGFGAKTFYDQGRFMEAFEDDYDYRGDFAQYFPTYQHMTDVQLRGYFSWRTKVRKGTVEKTSLSFAFVYIYELLNQIGVRTPLDGFHALRNFWTAYREHDARINGYVGLWLKDYVIYNNLDKSLLEGLSDIVFDRAVVVLLDYKSYGADEVFAALNSLSAYDLEKSRFFKLHPEDVRNVVHRVFSVVSEYHNRKPQKSACDKMFGRVCVSSYSMFKSAVFFHRTGHADRVYEIGTCHRYICRSGRWSCERFLWYGTNNRQIGALLKTVDYLMRQRYGFNSTLRMGKINKIITGKIDKEIAKYLEDKRKNVIPEIAIDTSKLQTIRTTALATQSKLLVDEPEDEAPPEAEAVVENNAPETPSGLSDDERRLMECLLNGGDPESLFRGRGLLLSVLVDAVNEKLYDLFGDTVIADEGGRPVPIEDYREELKGMFER